MSFFIPYLFIRRHLLIYCKRLRTKSAACASTAQNTALIKTFGLVAHAPQDWSPMVARKGGITSPQFSSHPPNLATFALRRDRSANP